MLDGQDAELLQVVQSEAETKKHPDERSISNVSGT
jgi:hypothetical protein